MLPLSRALLYIFLSAVAVSGSTTLGWLYYVHLNYARAHDERFLVTAIVQTGPQAKQLPTAYLAELLDVSIDSPSNLYTFDCREARKKLLKSPHILSAAVKRLRPNAIYVDYHARVPKAYLGNFDNVLIDRDGVPFPASPYFTPKRLPELMIGDEAVVWGKVISSKQMRLALALLCLLEQEKIYPSKIDVSAAYHESMGRAEVVLEFDRGPVSLLRWRPLDFIEQVADFKLLLQTLNPYQRVIVDMRVSQLAFIPIVNEESAK